MAEVKITDLPVGQIQAGDIVLFVRSGTTYQAELPLYNDIVFNKAGIVTPSEYLDIGNVSSEDAGFLAPIDMTLVGASVTRSDTDQAWIEVVIDGVAEEEIETNGNLIYNTSLPVDAGSIISARNKLGSSNMSNVVLALYFKYF